MPDQVTTEEENNEFDDAFAEAAGKKGQAVDDAPMDEDSLPGEEGEPPAPEVTDPEEVDPYAGLPEAAVNRIKELEEQNQNLEHRVKSDSGRVAAFQRQVDELREQIQGGIKQGQSDAEDAGTASSDAPTADQVAEAMATDEGWEEFTQEYPEIASAIDKRLESKLGAFKGEVTETIKPVLSKAQQDEIEKGYDYLDSRYEGWRDRVASPVFQEWIETQPDVVRKWADSDDPNEASSLIEYYDNYLTATGKMSEFEKQDGGNDGPPGDDDEDSEASDLQRRRQQQLEDGDAIDSRGAGVGTGDGPAGGEFESAFQAYASRKERERRSA